MHGREAFQSGYLDAKALDRILPFLKKRPEWAVASISEFDAKFLYGLVCELKPARILEVGVASGWGSCIIMDALKSSGVDRYNFFGVDIAERFFYDDKYETGECVKHIMPGNLKYDLRTGVLIADVVEDIGPNLDLGFIDANHMHPWAALDMLAIMPYMREGSYVALHDLSLSRKEDQLHKNRGPKYLYEGWEGEKVHSVQYPAMIGAIRVDTAPEQMLSVIEDVLYTPWEVPVEHPYLLRLVELVGRKYGPGWAEKVKKAVDNGNYIIGRMNTPEQRMKISEQVARVMEDKPRDFWRRLKALKIF